MAAKYEFWAVPDLKKELIRRNASTSGRKADLIERIKAYDRNLNFKAPQPLDIGWPKSGFQQLLPQHKILLPLITKSQIEGYFLYRMAEDHDAANDIKAMDKGSKMFAANRILACSIYYTANDIYLSGIVGAAMKRVTYNYKIKIDKTGEPKASQCECPGGKGPHGTCKHVAAVPLMLEHFKATGNVCIEKSCTENLQTFQEPKSYYTGSPVKVRNISSMKKPSDGLLEDPRPNKYRNMSGYNDYVRNAVTNYCFNASKDIAFRYLYGKANIQSAVKDHSYLDVPFTEYWIDRALQVSEKSAADIEIKNTFTKQEQEMV